MERPASKTPFPFHSNESTAPSVQLDVYFYFILFLYFSLSLFLSIVLCEFFLSSNFQMFFCTLQIVAERVRVYQDYVTNTEQQWQPQQQWSVIHTQTHTHKRTSVRVRWFVANCDSFWLWSWTKKQTTYIRKSFFFSSFYFGYVSNT